MTAIDPINYGDGPASDAQGRIAFPALIPGATYRIAGLSKEFTVKPGETLDLGDIRIEKPRLVTHPADRPGLPSFWRTRTEPGTIESASGQYPARG